MGKITINYTNLDETSHSQEFPDDSTEIRLFLREMKSIDLTPLSQCENLELLILNHSHAEEIDFSPLSACKNLRKLHLENNRFRKIDLSPLVACSNIVGVWLNGNSLKEVDISPLFACTNLGIIELDEETIPKAQNHLGDMTVQSAGISEIINRIEWF